jgi:PKD repeat protein
MSRTIHVSTREELNAALRSATGGETILLAPGNYDEIAISPVHHGGFSFDYSSPVTIASSDPSSPAVVTKLWVWPATNMIFDGLHFDYTYNPALGFEAIVDIRNSHGVIVRNSVFTGDYKDGLPFSQAVNIRNSTDIHIEDSFLTEFEVALGVIDSSGIEIRGNEFTMMRRDGLNIGRHNEGVLIEGNHFHNFFFIAGDPGHPDFIQFWTIDSTISPTENIVIRGNIMDTGAADAVQSIFMRNERVDMGLAGSEMFYRNILIEDNTIYSGHLHGITVGEADGLVIRNNAMLFVSPDYPLGTSVPAALMPRINVKEASKNVVIENNVTFSVSGWSGQSDWDVQGNVFLQAQNPLADGYYGDVFITSSLDLGADNVHAFIALPGGALDRPDLGVASLLPSDSAQLAGQFNVRIDAENIVVRVFDASIGMAALPEGTKFLWDFGDGITATGPVVSHAFPEAGRHDVSLTAQLPSGEIVKTDAQIPISGSRVLSLESDGIRSFSYGEEFLAVSGEFSDGVALGGPGFALQIPHNSLNSLFLADSFEIALSIIPAHFGASGAVFRLHGSFAASVTTSGELRFDMGTEAGAVAVQTLGAGLHDSAGRDIRIRFDDGVLQIFSDEVLVGEVFAEAAKLSPAITGHTLVFGDPFGRANFPGQLTAFEIDVDVADYAEARLLWEEASDGMALLPGGEDPAGAPTLETPVEETEDTGDGEEFDVVAPEEETPDEVAVEESEEELIEPVGEEDGETDPPAADLSEPEPEDSDSGGVDPVDAPTFETPVEEPEDVEHDTGLGADPDVPPVAEETPVVPAIAGRVVDRAGVGLGDAVVSFSPDAGAQVDTVTDGLGGFGFDLDAEMPGQLEVTRAHGVGDPAVTMQSVIEVLRLSVGMKPTWGEATAFDYLAADFNGDGKVNSADAQHMLRAAAGMSTPFEARWVFVESEADLSHITRNNVTLPAGPRIEDFGSGAVQVDMVGIIVGQMQEF